MMEMSTWNKGKSDEDISSNAAAAHRALAALFCARVFIFKQLLDCFPAQTDPKTARKRWVLLQVLPALLEAGDDIFVTVLSSLRGAEKMIMQTFIRNTLWGCLARKNLFPDADKVDNATPLFIVIDEAQEAADQLTGFFRSEKDAILHPILRELYMFCKESKLFSGIIIVGTRLSTVIVKDAVRSVSVRFGENEEPTIFTNTGLFLNTEPSQGVYVRRYLKLSDSCASDVRLMERILHWFSGRHRLTAGIIELLLHSEHVPRHRVLPSFVKHLTGFTITDAVDLEEQEGPIPDDVAKKISKCGQLSLVKRLFEEPNREELVQCLVDVLMRWVMGSQLTSIPIEHNMHEMIGLGVGHLTAIPQQFDPGTNYPVYIDEPLMVLSLSLLFDSHDWTTRKQWITNSFRAARDRSALGVMFEEMALLVVMENFGGKSTALGDVFLCKQPSLGSRKVTLVSLTRDADHNMRCCPVSWNAGSSDRLGFKAQSPTDVLEFFQDPNGKAFLFPDNHMGPDIIFFVQDEVTKELILMALQSNLKAVKLQTWLAAINSVTPKFFYTVVKKDGTRAKYAPLVYPNLTQDMKNFFVTTLGPEIHSEVQTAYRAKLRSLTEQNLARRQTPRFLRIIAADDDNDNQQHRLTAETGDVIGLKWDAVKGYAGSAADILQTTPGSLN